MGGGSGAASSTEHGDTRGKNVVAPACVRENGEGEGCVEDVRTHDKRAGLE